MTSFLDRLTFLVVSSSLSPRIITIITITILIFITGPKAIHLLSPPSVRPLPPGPEQKWTSPASFDAGRNCVKLYPEQ